MAATSFMNKEWHYFACMHTSIRPMHVHQHATYILILCQHKSMCVHHWQYTDRHHIYSYCEVFSDANDDAMENKVIREGMAHHSKNKSRFLSWHLTNLAPFGCSRETSVQRGTQEVAAVGCLPSIIISAVACGARLLFQGWVPRRPPKLNVYQG